MRKELPVFPQITYSSANGKTGTRQWVLDACEDVDAFVSELCSSHWPGDKNTVPILIQEGARNKAMIEKEVALNELPHYNETLVTAQYQFLHVSDCWPSIFPKPKHRAGTVLTMRVRGSAQAIAVDPAVFMPRAVSSDPNQPGWGGTPVLNSRIFIPLAEYHITCDRMTEEDLEDAMSTPHWKRREGTLNYDTFLGEEPGTLLFDNWELDNSFAPDTNDPRRYKLTAILKARQIQKRNKVRDEAIGWNYDYWYRGDNDYGWRFLVMRDSDDVSKDVPRFFYMTFGNMFCSHSCKDDCVSDSDVSSVPPASSSSLYESLPTDG